VRRIECYIPMSHRALSPIDKKHHQLCRMTAEHVAGSDPAGWRPATEGASRADELEAVRHPVLVML
jgi:hypothetical protein